MIMRQSLDTKVLNNRFFLLQINKLQEIITDSLKEIQEAKDHLDTLVKVTKAVRLNFQMHKFVRVNCIITSAKFK